MQSLLKYNPKWLGILRPGSGEGLSLDCPVCGASHKLVVYFDNPVDGKEKASWQQIVWKRTGDSFENITIEPSIQYQCFHGWIEKGQVIDIKESPAIVQALINNNGILSLQNVALSPMQFEDFKKKK